MLVSHGKMSVSQVNAIVSQFEALEGADIQRTNASIKVFMPRAERTVIKIFSALKITGGYLVMAQDKLLDKTVLVVK